MCGIAGYYIAKNNNSIELPNLKAMIDKMKYRGPDESSYYTSYHIGLAHARLSIIDLEGGKQPIHNEDKSLWVILNGEIYCS